MKALKNFQDLTVFYRYFSGPISLFLEVLLFLPYIVTSDFERSSFASAFGRNSFNRGMEELDFYNSSS